MNIDELIDEKGKMELAMLTAMNKIRKEFEDKTGAALQDITFSGTYVMEFDKQGNFKLFTDCECKIEYKGVKVGGS